ncbi:indole-3-glycerol phosphate synthase TrpC [Salmonirosea aquatica]|uniref:indole-3-glycerol-phosphate synthase n=1 Tax=Salmonirosea aquatica TaxID=2654236 RepID=A0A7C9FRX2_9BACT|nr:indole-3-glycerol phosphate synthase TrpC [Cytophagaceae bacterium SJW1-29]
MNILEKIVAHKRSEVAASKVAKHQRDFEKDTLFSRPTLSLAHALRQTPAPGIIAEFKRQSPSKGIINAHARPEVVTAGFTAGGAKGLSVLTDTEFFGGTFDDFSKARAANPHTPMLRKDFMVDEYQLFEAKSLGADVILLIAACLSPQEVQTLARKAHELKLEVLLEVHNAEELRECLCEDVDMVGVNNRNLKTFSTFTETSLELAETIPDTFVKISESGLKDTETILNLFQHGYQGFLIGETFMKTSDPAVALEHLQNTLSLSTNHKSSFV